MKKLEKPGTMIGSYTTGRLIALLAVLILAGVVVMPYAGSEQNLTSPAEAGVEAEALEIITETETEVINVTGETEEADDDRTVETAVGEGDLVSISTTEGRIQDVLRSLAAMRPGTTIMIDPAVAGDVSFELQQVPWETALYLMADAHGLEIVQRDDNVYMVKTAAIQVDDERDLIIEVFSSEEIEKLPENQLLSMYRGYRDIPEDMTTEQVRAEIMAKPHFFLRQLTVVNRQAIEVINQLARKSDVDFVFSTHFETEAGEEQTTAERKRTYDQGPPISLNLRNRPIPAAIRLAAEQGGLAVSHQDGIWIVKPMRPEQRELEPLVSETFRVRYIAVDDKLIKDLERMASSRGKIIARGKTVTVFDTAANIEKIERVIKDQDVPIPQVLIEARFFVLTDTTSHELGIDWQSFTDRDDSGITFGADFHDLTYEYYDLGRILDPRTATLSMPRLTAILHALDAMDKAEQLSNPKILVSSDEQATIHIGRQEPILRSTVAVVDGETIRTYELDTNFGGETVQVANLLADRPNAFSHGGAYTGYTGYLDLGTKLTVAPSVKTEDEVYIRIIPELINKPGEITVGEDAFRQTFPELYRVRVQTQFTLRSGQTIAIGGLVSENMETVQKGIPLLGKLPLAGRLFRYDSERTVRSETIIFLTVRVISPDQLDTISGLPVSARDVQPAVDTIRRQDEEGAVYNEERRREEWRLYEERSNRRRFLSGTQSERPIELQTEETQVIDEREQEKIKQGITEVEVENITPRTKLQEKQKDTLETEEMEKTGEIQALSEETGSENELELEEE